jgi:hypothetical protein
MRILLIAVLFSGLCHAGVDLQSTVERLKVSGDGKLWIKMTSSRFDDYCKPGWYGFNMYIPESDPSYPFYYAVLNTALSNGNNVYLANISHFDGTTACDLTKTGYGVVIQR